MLQRWEVENGTAFALRDAQGETATHRNAESTAVSAGSAGKNGAPCSRPPRAFSA